MDDEQHDLIVGEDEEGARPKPRVVDKRFSARPASSPAPAPVPSPAPAPAPSPAAASSPAAARPPGTPEQEAEARRMAEEIAAVHSRDWVVSMAMNLVNVAGVKLESGPLEEAQLAIDALAAIVRDVGPRLGDAEVPLRGVLSQLQMAYAQVASGPSQ